MHQTGESQHPSESKLGTEGLSVISRLKRSGWLVAVAVCVFAVAGNGQQSGIPDAPSASKPADQLPSAPAAQAPKNLPPPETPLPGESTPQPVPNAAPPTTENPAPAEENEQARPPLDIKTVPEGGATQEQSGAQEELYKITTNVNQVLVPVMVKDDSGRLVSGLLPKDFVVYEDGNKQKLNFFTSDPFALSAAVVLDLGMPDIAVQKVSKTYSALVGSFGQYDEVSIYTYSSTYSKQQDFVGAANNNLSATFNSLKTATGRNNGVPVTSGPLGPQGPTINNIPVNPNASIITPPPKEAHVLNDAILAAAHDLSKRDRTRRRIIFVISDGKETGSTASYADVLKVLLSNNILVYGVGVDSAALPGYGKLQKIRIPGYNYTANILPKYANATGGEIFTELNQNAIEEAYTRAIGDARNQYTLGYVARSTPSSKKREIEVRVDRPGCKSSDLRPCVDVFAKDGYYPLPPGR